MKVRKKLIEVALPLDAINKASAREKSIRHGHPSTLHLWWARRPLAAARAVIFAQMVDDPSSWPELFPTEKAQEKERKRLFRIIEELVQWENTTNERVLEAAREEIWQSWRRACAENADHPRARELFDRDKLPAFHDPFAGGGSLPLEAQRLGLEAYASDLNPVAVLINKAMIEIPPKFAGRPPVNPEWQRKPEAERRMKTWRGAEGLAADVRYYGKWMRDEAEKRIGHLYPKIEITAEMAKERSDLEKYVGRKLTVIAWLWARTVKSPNPAFSDVDVPLASTFMLSTKKGKEAYVEPVIEGGGYRFTVKVGKPKDEEAAKRGTKLSRGANFRCLVSSSPISGDYIKEEGKAGRMAARMMAIIAEGERERVYLAPNSEQVSTAVQAQPGWAPDFDFFQQALGFRVGNYGMTRWSDLFSVRQLLALDTLSRLIEKLDDEIAGDAGSGASADNGTDIKEYAKVVAIYLAFAVDKGANYWSTLCAWHLTRDSIVSTFGRQTLPMVWDYAEGNPFSTSSGNFSLGIDQAAAMLQAVGSTKSRHAFPADAVNGIREGTVVSTDPPYYDNIGYADLSDFFYVWLRRSLQRNLPDLFSTLVVPKEAELVATPARHGGREEAERFFLGGMSRALRELAHQSHPAFPVSIYYAFKQTEREDSHGIARTGWETFLEAVMAAGLGVSGTWPIRTEYGNKEGDRNALASSIVLICRKREGFAASVTRREFISVLKAELPVALTHLQRGNIAPVDLAQAAIGPGMAVFTRYSKVLDADGKPLTVRDALALINRTLDEALAEQEGDFDADTRWALAWFERHGFAEGEYGAAETLSKAKNTSVQGLADAGILSSRGGKVRLLAPKELTAEWDPAKDPRLNAWEVVHHLICALESGGEGAAAELVGKLGSKAEIARELAYRLFNLSDRKKRAAEALAYNGLVQSWPEIQRLAKESAADERPAQGGLFAEAG